MMAGECRPSFVNGDTGGMQLRAFNVILAIAGAIDAQRPARADLPEHLFVDAATGHDSNPGNQRRPLRSMSAAIARLPELIDRAVTIETSGRHEDTGGNDAMPAGKLVLMRRMRPGVVVTIVGRRDADDRVPVFGWHGDGALVEIHEGGWRLENLEIGSSRTDQRRGVYVRGTADVTLKDVTFRTRSDSDAGIWAERGGRVSLRGTIRMNEHLRDVGGEETFCGIVATDHGMVTFVERDGASLDIGNGSLSASYYGCIGLGCSTAQITSWGRNSNCLAVNNGGRIDVRDTPTTLRAKVRENTPIGPEHDGHILAEGATITIVGANDTAIALQKASTFTCNDIVLQGEFGKAIWAMSGSMFVGRFLSDVGRIEAHTGASVHVEGCKGELRGPIETTTGAVVSLPDGRVVRD